MFWIFALIAAGLAGLFFWMGKSRAELKDKMDSMETTPVGQLSRGYVEVKGVVSCDQPLKVPHVDHECVYYSYRVERRERETDSDGDTRYRWRTIDSGQSETVFTLTDDSGAVLVDPRGAETDAPKVFEGYIDDSFDFGSSDGILGALGQIASFASRSDCRITVHAIALERELYILGNVKKRSDEQLIIAKGKEKFFISTRSEDELSSSYGTSSMVFYVLAGVCGVGALVLAVMGLSG